MRSTDFPFAVMPQRLRGGGRPRGGPVTPGNIDLGVFKTPAKATAFAEKLHKDQERTYVKKARGGFAVKKGR